jgi:hypothetical protein
VTEQPDSKNGTHDQHPPACDEMRQVVSQALDVLAPLLLEAIHLHDLRDQHVIGLTDRLAGHVRRPREAPIRHGIQRPADNVAILGHQALKVVSQVWRAQLKPHDQGRGRADPRSLATIGPAMALAFDEPSVLRSRTIGESWFAVAGRIIASGVPSTYDGMPIRELSLVTLVVEHPDPYDEIIATHADPERLAWMHANFTDHAQVASLGDADSYATRLFDYEHSGRDQVQWVIDRLRAEPSSRSATVTTFQPHTDTTYIPCVSLLDFWLPDGAVELVVYAHSIDFGAKGYGNLVELASLQRHVADALGVPVGRLLMIIKSAHVYETELNYIERAIAAATGSTRSRRAGDRGEAES